MVILPDSPWTCPSCGSISTTRYCGNCGERRLNAEAPDAAGHSAGPASSFLERVRASAAALLWPPGRITVDWIRGRRVGYLVPLSIFLWINVIFFLVQSLSGLGILAWPLRAHLSDDWISRFTTWLLSQHKPGFVPAAGTYAEVFDALEAVHAKSLVIVMVPVFAAVLGVLMLDRREPFRNTLTFATHFFAFALLWLSALFPVAAIVLRLIVRGGFMALSNHELDLVISFLEAGGFAWYLYVALGTVFGLSRPRRAVTVVALIAALFVILKAYHVVVFAVTLYST